ncbi:MAG: GntR family transcriptional regulator [Kofleriaceae bacterium]
MQRQSLSHNLEDEVRDLVVRGELSGRVNEVHLAEQLTVSRTPLREALTRLAGEHFLEAKPRHGFFVPPLTVDEVHQLYPIRARLDPWALELAGIPDKDAFFKLHELNERLGAARSAEQVIALDDEWHLLLLAHCPNRVLVDLIQQMIWRTRRYEQAYFRATKNIGNAYEEHGKLLTALRKKDLALACKRLADNMTSAIPELVAWLGAPKAVQP